MSDLQISPGSLGGIDHVSAPVDPVSHHLLAKNVFACLQSGHREWLVQPKRRRHNDRFDVVAFQHRFKVGVPLGRRIVKSANFFEASFEMIGGDVAKGHEVHVAGRTVFDQDAALTAAAHDPGPHGSHPAGLPQESSCWWQCDHRLEKIPSADFSFFLR